MSITCDKEIYLSQREAINAIKGIAKAKKSKRKKHSPVRAYYCEGCNGWHLTSKRKKRISNKKIPTLSLQALKIKKKDGNKILKIKTFTST